MVSPARAAVERVMAPGYGCCYRCQRPWKFAKAHTTPFITSEGCFPLCESCWAELGTPEERWPYYQALIEAWAAMGCPTEYAAEIKAAVMEGL